MIGNHRGRDARRFRTVFALPLLLGWHLAGQAASCSVDPQRPKVYRLELTVPATFCRGRSSDAGCQTFPKPSLIQLHGLWPNYLTGYPEGQCAPDQCVRQHEKLGTYCRYPSPPGLYQASWWNGLKAYMAGTESCLERHEWVKHGICTPMEARNYFRWSLETTKGIATRLRLPSDQVVSRKDFSERVRGELPELDGAIRLACRGSALASLSVLYEWGAVPAKPIPTRGKTLHFGNCPNAFLIPAVPPE